MLNKKLDTLKTFLIEEGEATQEELNGLTVENCYNDSCKTFEIIGIEY